MHAFSYLRAMFSVHRVASALLLLGTGLSSPTSAKPAPAIGCNDPEYRQFDFWIGDWDSYDSKGVLQGHNLVQKVLDRCAIQEWWLGTDGAVGSSFSIYDRSRNVWNQTWVSNKGRSSQSRER